MRLARHPFLTLPILLALLAGCGQSEPPKPPDKITSVTTVAAARRDLPVTESAVGSETVLATASDYDPSRGAAATRYVRLPFPEHVAARLSVGQAVSLASFERSERAVSGTIREIRPALNATTLSREVIVAVRDAGWRPVGSVRGEVVLGVKRNAIVVPEQAVVLRPNGSVVYAVEAGKAREQSVRTGIARDGVIEILEGLKGDETVVVDGAGLLTDGAALKARATVEAAK